MSAVVIFLALLAFLLLIGVIRFRPRSGTARFLRRNISFFMTLAVPIAGALAIWLINNEKDTTIETSLIEHQKEIALKDERFESLLGDFKTPFAFMQAEKLKWMISDSLSSKLITAEIQKLERLAVISTEFLCTVDLYELETGESDTFRISTRIYQGNKMGDDVVRVLMKSTNSDSFASPSGWDTLVASESYSNVTDCYTADIPVPRRTKVLIRVDRFKPGWKKESPLSFVGVDTREYSNPPTELGFWLFFVKTPILFDTWSFTSKEIEGILSKGDTALVAAILNNERTIVDREAVYTKGAKFDDSTFGFTSQFSNWASDSSVSYRVVFKRPGKEFYGVSFWQGGVQLNNGVNRPSQLPAFLSSSL